MLGKPLLITAFIFLRVGTFNKCHISLSTNPSCFAQIVPEDAKPLSLNLFVYFAKASDFVYFLFSVPTVKMAIFNLKQNLTMKFWAFLYFSSVLMISKASLTVFIL